MRLIETSLVLFVLVACGPAEQPGQATNQPARNAGADTRAGPADQGPEPTVLTVVLRPGADPQAVGRRIVGAPAVVRQAGSGSSPTYLVTVPAGHEDEALRRAQGDPDVQSASFNLKGPPKGAPGG